MLKKLTVTLLLIITIFCSCAFAIRLPSVAIPESSTVYDINGKVVKGLSEQNQVNVDLEEISPYFINGVIAIEDKRFYRHHGIDVSGMMRALFLDLKAGKIIAGGSTITQQTAKTLYLTNERTVSRKIKELYYAFLMENRYSKDEILTMYCNSIYFGHGAYGIELASRTFFAKRAQDLTLAQASLLAGIPQSPSYYDPYINPEEARKRQTQVLQRMVEEGMISEAERETALQEPLTYKKAQFADDEAPYFVAMVRDHLREQYGDSVVYKGGLKVYTTLDLDMQKAANTAYLEGMKNQNPDLQVALAALDVKNGQIRALVGGRDFNASSYNRVYSKRQPGSTFKPFIYSLAIEQGLTPASLIPCEEKEFELPNGDIYKPTDYGTEPYHWRDFTLKEAIGISDNVVAVTLTDILGVNEATRYARQFGFNDLEAVLSLPLGSNEVTPLDMAAGYSVFANQGIYNPPVYLLKVVDKNGNVLEKYTPQAQSIVSTETAYIITNMLIGVMEPGGTGSALKAKVGRVSAGKTGTTEQKNDAWFVGYTPQLACAVWVGYDQGKAANLYGGSAAGPIWASFIHDASAKLPEKDFDQPGGVDLMSICLDTGLIATEFCPRRSTMAFLKDNEPEDICYLHQPNMDWSGSDADGAVDSGYKWWQLWE
ncbi:MAG: PBP1A family penicillin-binding protein [Syntrophomonadaceae bacterium]|nr:PBP1A family penicillin-binding protein [Syntrophomonadaceae bacterium]